MPEDWEVTTVGNLVRGGILEKPLDGNHGSIHPKSGDFVSFGIPFVMANNVKDGRVDLSNCAFIRKEQADSLRKGFSRTGDVLLTHKATIGNTAIVGEMPSEYVMLTPQVTYYRVADHSRLSNSYLRYAFDASSFQNILHSMSGGVTRAYIGICAQLQLPVVLPPSTIEQEAIAEALGDTDQLIQSLEQLLVKKRDVKRGAMEELLTGDRRLPGFSGKWASKRVDEFTGCTSGGTPSTRIPEYWGGTIRWMSSGELNLKLVGEVEGRITGEGLRNSSTKMIPADCVLIGLAGQGKTRGTVATNLVPLCTNQSIAAIFPSPEYETKYLYYNLDARYEELRELSARGGGRGGLNLTIIRSLVVPFPCHEEQSAIAAVLFDLDADISALEDRLVKTRQVKHGMMQELLTGRIRLV